MDVRKSIDESVIELKNDLVEGQSFNLPTEKQYERAIKFYQLIDKKFKSGLEIISSWQGTVIFEWDVNTTKHNQLAILIYDKDELGYAYHINGKSNHGSFSYDYGNTIPELIIEMMEKLNAN